MNQNRTKSPDPACWILHIIESESLKAFLDTAAMSPVIIKHAFPRSQQKAQAMNTNIHMLLIILGTKERCFAALLNLQNHLHTSANLYFFANWSQMWLIGLFLCNKISQDAQYHYFFN